MKIQFDKNGKRGETWEVIDSSSLSHGSQICKDVQNLTNVNWKLDNLKDGYQMFLDCKNLTDFYSDLILLKSGYEMFKGCSLSYESIDYISKSINDVTNVLDWEGISKNRQRVLHLGCGDLTEEQKTTVGDALRKKGWKVYFNDEMYISATAGDFNAEGEKYIPDATNWNSEIYYDNGLIITSVVNETAFNGEKFVCKLLTNQMINATNLMQYNENLTLWQSELDSLEIGNYMFDGCSNLETLIVGDYSKLKNAVGMFRNCGKLQQFNHDLNSLENGSEMFKGCFQLESFISSLENLTECEKMFTGCSNLKIIETNLKNLTIGNTLFSGLLSLSSFKGDLSNLTKGNGIVNGEIIGMFQDSHALETFESDLSSLEVCTNMFNGCNLKRFNANMNLLTDINFMFDDVVEFESFISDLSSLTVVPKFFSNKGKLTTFNSNLSSLTNGYWEQDEKQTGMFEKCVYLNSFEGSLESLIDGTNMFNGCINLTSFKGSLINLETATDMFYGCSLDGDSVADIVNSLKNNKNTGSIELYVDVFYQEEVEEIFEITESVAGDLIQQVGTWTITIKYV